MKPLHFCGKEWQVVTLTHSCSHARFTDDQYAAVCLSGKQTEVAMDGKTPGNPCHLRDIFLLLSFILCFWGGNSMCQCCWEFFCELLMHGWMFVLSRVEYICVCQLC